MTDKIIMSLLVNTAVFSVLFCAMLIIRKAAGKKISPALMLVMWAVIAVKLIMPFGFESGLSIIPSAAVSENAPYEYIQPTENIPDTITEAYHPAQPAGSDINTEKINAETNNESAVINTQSAVYETAVNIDWTIIALGIWGAGIITVMLGLCLSAANIKRRIVHSRIDTPKYILVLTEGCKAVLGIRRNVGVTVQSAIDRPVIMGAVKPVLVLPENSSALDKDALRHVLLHELTHLKRGDLWAIRLMNILAVLYWFNPLVWLCFRLIREDMEIACDQSVIKAIGIPHRLSYIGTVLQFAQQGKKENRLAAAMGLFDGRPAIERRIRGMYGKAKTGARGRIVAGIIALLIFAAGVLTACQPVSGEAKQWQTLTAEYMVAEHWNETINDGKLTIKIDADVMEPKAGEYPVVKVEPIIFSQQRIDELVNYFAKGKRLYLPQAMKTKSQYQQEIEELLTPKWLGGRLVVKADEKFRASQLEKEMANAPESYPKEYIDSTLTYDIDYETKAERTESGKNFLTAMVENGDGKDPRIGACNYTDDYMNFTYFAYNTPQSYEYRSETSYKLSVYNIDLDGNPSAEDDRKNYHIEELAALFGKVTLNKDDARAQAEKAITDLGIKDMILVDASKAVSLEYPDKGGWQFEYVRQNGGVPTSAAGTLYYRNGSNIYLNVYPETLTVLVTDNGLESFVWGDCSNRIETVSESEKLLPFDDIKQALKKKISEDSSKRLEMKGYKASSGDIVGYEMEDLTFMVKSARLCMCYIGTEYDDNSIAMIVPVWAFETEFSYYDPAQKQTRRSIEEPYIIDARDGSVMEGTIIAAHMLKYNQD